MSGPDGLGRYIIPPLYTSYPQRPIRQLFYFPRVPFRRSSPLSPLIIILLTIFTRLSDLRARKYRKRLVLTDDILLYSVDSDILYTLYFRKKVKYIISNNSSRYTEYVRRRRSYDRVLIASSRRSILISSLIFRLIIFSLVTYLLES